jgi:hypothetical protein
MGEPVKPSQLPQGCGYQGYEFGAGSYPDSLCCGGKLYDADDCDDDKNLYQPTEHIPCPICHRNKAMAYWADRNRLSGVGVAEAQIAARSLVRDIRRNRGVKP